MTPGDSLQTQTLITVPENDLLHDPRGHPQIRSATCCNAGILSVKGRESSGLGRGAPLVFLGPFVRPTHVRCWLSQLPVSPSRGILRATSSSPSKTNWSKLLTLRDTGPQVRQRTQGHPGAHVIPQEAVQRCGVDVGPAIRPVRHPRGLQGGCLGRLEGCSD